jgi:IPT/TIG domain
LEGRHRRSAIAAAAFLLCLLGIAAVPDGASLEAPAISGIAPNNGTDGGGTSVTIKGSGFTPVSTVKFGRHPASGVVVQSPESMTVQSPAGHDSELVAVTVSNSEGTSAAVGRDQFAYDLPPASPWLGLNDNSVSNSVSKDWLGPVNEFSRRGIDYDRSFEVRVAGEIPRGIEPGAPHDESGFEARLRYDHVYGMIPVSTIEYRGYRNRFASDPFLPRATRTVRERREGKTTIGEYVEGFITSAKSILDLVNRRYRGMRVLFEPMNEPWGYTTPQYNAAQYADVIAQLLPKARAASIPASDIYVGAIGEDCTVEDECTTNGWVPGMYAAHPKLETEIGGWYLHPYGPPSGLAAYDNLGIEVVPAIQGVMRSGQNNIIISEVGYCVNGLNRALENPPCGQEGEEAGKAAWNLKSMLHTALHYREAGWLRALIVYGRVDGGWAMQRYPSKALTKEGEVLDIFAGEYGLTWPTQR